MAWSEVLGWACDASRAGVADVIELATTLPAIIAWARALHSNNYTHFEQIEICNSEGKPQLVST